MAIGISGSGISTAQLFQRQVVQSTQGSTQNQSNVQVVDSDGDKDHGAPENAGEQHIDVRI